MGVVSPRTERVSAWVPQPNCLGVISGFVTLAVKCWARWVNSLASVPPCLKESKSPIYLLRWCEELSEV